MALCRCKNHRPISSKNEYVHFVKPLNHGNDSMICGRNNCTNEGLIWLTKKELLEHNNGQRIMYFASAVCKVKVQ
jgi:hypothetical protein